MTEARTATTAAFTLADDDLETFTGGPGGPILLSALVLPWDTPVPMGWRDTVEFAPGSVNPPVPSRVKFALDHRTGGGWFADSPKPFGYGVSFEDRPDGLHGTFAVPRDELDDPEVAAAVRQIRNGVRDGVSVGVSWEADGETVTPIDGQRYGSHRRVTAADMYETSTVVIPRFDGARISSIAAARLTSSDTQPDVDPDDDTDQEVDPMPDTTTTTDDVDETERLSAHRDAVRGQVTHIAPRARFATLGHFVQSFARGEVDEPYVRAIEAALAQQVTGDTPGIIPELWLKNIVNIMGQSSATIQAFDRRPLPASGMVFNVPVFTQLPDVGVQGPEFTQVHTRKLLITKVAFNVVTYAGAQSVSIQEILRSDPAYITSLMEGFAIESAIQMDTDAAVKVLAGATLAQILDPTSATTLNATLIDAAAKVLTSVLTWPDVIVLSTGLWKILGKAVGTDGRPVFPGLSPMNPMGSFSLVDNGGNIRGLQYWVDPLMTAEEGVLGISRAFQTYQDSVQLMQTDTPATASRDIGIFQFAAMGVTDGRGLVHLTHSGAPGIFAAEDAGKAKK